MIDANRLYSVGELAELLHMHPQSIYRWLRQGVIHRAPTKGRRVLILGREVLENVDTPADEPAITDKAQAVAQLDRARADAPKEAEKD